MINRELIRLKLVQITYSFYQNGSKNPAVAEKELLLSLSRAYDLYNSMLLLMVELNRMALRMLEMRQSRARRLGESDFVSAKFVENRFMLQLESNKQLREYRENQRFDWSDQEEYVRSLYNKIRLLHRCRNLALHFLGIVVFFNDSVFLLFHMLINHGQHFLGLHLDFCIGGNGSLLE